MSETSGSRTSTAMTARSRRTRAALVDAVHTQLRSSGSFDADSVAALAGCSAATFYSHFGSKDDALAAVFRLVLDDLVKRSAALLTIERVYEFGLDKTIVDLVEQQAEYFSSETLVFRVALSKIPQHRGLREAYRDAEAADIRRLSQLIAEGQRAGLIRQGPVEVMASAILVLAQGINNPRALRSDASGIRAEIAHALASVLQPIDQGITDE